MSGGYDITSSVAASWVLSKPKKKSEIDDVPLEALVPLKKLTLDEKDNSGKKKKKDKKDKKSDLTFVVQPTSYKETRKTTQSLNGTKQSSLTNSGTKLSSTVELFLTWLHERVRSPPGPPFLPYDDSLLLSAIQHDPEIGDAFDRFGITGLLALKPQMFELREFGFGRPDFRTDFDHLQGPKRKPLLDEEPTFGKFTPPAKKEDSESAFGYGFYGYGSMKEQKEEKVSKKTLKKSLMDVQVPNFQEFQAYGQFPYLGAGAGFSGDEKKLLAPLFPEFGTAKISDSALSAYGAFPVSDSQKAKSKKSDKKAIFNLVNSEFGFVYTQVELKSYVASCCQETGLNLEENEQENSVELIVKYIRAKNAHQEDDLCPICLERANFEFGLVRAERTDCGHPFHSHCLTKWCSENSVCPVCRKYLVSQDEFPNL